MILIIILSVIVWYGLGMVGSAIGISSMAKSLDKMFPMLPPHNGREDKLFGYLIAMVGVFNLGSAIGFSLINTHNISMRWDWLK